MKINIYLNLDGNANEAVDFYVEALELNEPKVLRFKDLPKSDSYVVPDEMLEKVVHCNLDIENTTIVISDTTPAGSCELGSNVHLILQYDDFDKMQNAYTKLSAYSDILIPLSRNEFTPGFAMFKDQFGITWQMNLS